MKRDEEKGGRRKGKRGRSEEEEPPKGSEVGLGTAFAVENRAIRQDCTDTAARIARLDGILIASIKSDACSRCQLDTRSRYRGIHFVFSVAV